MTFWQWLSRIFGGGSPSPPLVNPKYPTLYGVTINNFTAPSVFDLAALKSLGVTLVRFDLENPDAGQAASTIAMVNAVRAAGLQILGISPYVAAGVAPTQALFDSQAAFVAGLVAGGGFWGIELMNEPNIKESVAESQVTPIQYMSYAATIASAVRKVAPTVKLISGGTSGYDPNWLAATSAVFPLVDYIGLHPYGVNPSQFNVIFAKIQSAYNKPVAQTEWEPTTATLPSAIASSQGWTPVFVIYNLDVLKASATLSAEFMKR